MNILTTDRNTTQQIENWIVAKNLEAGELPPDLWLAAKRDYVYSYADTLNAMMVTLGMEPNSENVYMGADDFKRLYHHMQKHSRLTRLRLNVLEKLPVVNRFFWQLWVFAAVDVCSTRARWHCCKAPLQQCHLALNGFNQVFKM